MIINLSYATFIRSPELFYNSKRQMSDIIAKAPMHFICVTGNAIKNLREKVFLILLLSEKYLLLDLNLINPIIRVLGNDVCIGIY